MEIPKIFFCRNLPIRESTELAPFIQEAFLLLFPNAIRYRWPDTGLESSTCFFLREADRLFWVEVATAPFSKGDITDYLAKACKIQSSSPSEVCGLLAAPDFEGGVRELLELVRMPVRFFSYHKAVPLGPLREPIPSPVLWIREMTTCPPSPVSPPAGPASSSRMEDSSVDLPVASWSRLNREELKEFIQFELDAACHKLPAQLA